MHPDEPVRGKTALVTGAARRLGAAIARALADAGANVAIHCNRSAQEAARLADELRASGAKSWIFQADLERTDALPQFFGAVCEETGGLDILVNNAGTFGNDGLMEFTQEALDRNMHVNALAPLVLARCFAAQGRTGAIVNLLDTMICDYDKSHVAYHLSKRMLDALTRMMAVEFAPAIRVNAVAPGLILPPAGAAAGYLERLAHTNPLGRHGEAKDVANAVLFLVRSPFVTGQTLFVDGGRHLRGSVYG